ncbi:hypothetical protein [Anaerosporobacter sp.]
MYYKISNKLDIELLREMETLLSESYSVYKTVMERMEFYLDLLERNYGKHRNFESEGSFLLLFTNLNSKKERQRILEYYGLKEDEAEVREIICEDEKNSIEWGEELYVLTEFHIILFYPRKKEENR